MESKFEGYAFREEIYHKKEQCPWFQFHQGERLYSSWVIKNLKEQADNLGPAQFTLFLKQTIAEQSKIHPDYNIYIGPKLDAKLNYGRPVIWLRNTSKDWLELEKIIIANSEPVHSRKA